MVRRKPVHGSHDGFGCPSKVRLGISITAQVLVAGKLRHQSARTTLRHNDNMLSFAVQLVGRFGITCAGAPSAASLLAGAQPHLMVTDPPGGAAKAARSSWASVQATAGEVQNSADGAWSPKAPKPSKVCASILAAGVTLGALGGLGGRGPQIPTK
jgi:hypothetical protein